jgi:hypothetical protein
MDDEQLEASWLRPHIDPPTQTPAEAPNLLPAVLPEPVKNEVAVAVLVPAVVDVAVGVVVPISAPPDGVWLPSDAARVAIEMLRRKTRIRRMHIITVGECGYHATGKLAAQGIRASAKEGLN